MRLRSDGSASLRSLCQVGEHSGGMALVAWPLVELGTYFAASLTELVVHLYKMSIVVSPRSPMLNLEDWQIIAGY